MNIEGMKTLYLKEVKRFLSVYNQTLISPIVNSLLFLIVFNLSIGKKTYFIGDVQFEVFVASGIIVMASMQNSFANTSSTLSLGKIIGTIIDILIPPLSAFELTFSIALAGVTRGVLVGFLVLACFLLFIPIQIHYLGFVLFYIIMASLFMSLAGMLTGIIAETFDQVSVISSYIITPFTFLSGTFYSVKELPSFWYDVSQFNPFFYIIDGFRYGITGYHDSSILKGSIILIGINIFLGCVCHKILKKGYFIKN